jgi:uncharacterized protein (TIGR03435 family)
MMLKALLSLALTATLGSAQTPPAFEVASVKLSPQRTGEAGYTRVDADAAQVRYSNVPLVNLIAIAYRFDSRLIQGPPWVSDQSYDITAKLPEGSSKENIPEMLQTLLADRFKLAIHRESKDQRVYFLVAGKDGPKLKNATESPHGQLTPNSLMGRSMTMGSLASLLAHAVHYQVMDKTGVTGSYDIDLRFAPENSKEAGLDIFGAIQEQLGLKLEPGRAPVETIVVDRAERTPAEN